MKIERIGLLVIGFAWMSGACLIEPNPAFREPPDDCSVGELDCECTPEGDCGPGLECVDEFCTVVSLASNATPYGPCPNADDAECMPSEMCVTGEAQGTAWSLCTIPCASSTECSVDAADECANLPGDGGYMLRCLPFIECSVDNPCPDGMLCMNGTMIGAPTVCVWPDY